jgi:hypothetical protein
MKCVVVELQSAATAQKYGCGSDVGARSKNERLSRDLYNTFQVSVQSREVTPEIALVVEAVTRLKRHREWHHYI